MQKYADPNCELCEGTGEVSDGLEDTMPCLCVTVTKAIKRREKEE